MRKLRSGPTLGERIGERFGALSSDLVIVVKREAAQLGAKRQHTNKLGNLFVAPTLLDEAQLLRLILQDPALTVTAFGRKRYELEDIFMGIVEGGRA